MFNTQIVSSDPFLDMPATSRALYFHLGMAADDEGFVYPQSVMRAVGASKNDLDVLIGKKFVLPFESGVIVLKHWHVNNTIRNDRRLPTTHENEHKSLRIDKSGVYSAIGNQDAATMRHEGRISNELINKLNRPSKEGNRNAGSQDAGGMTHISERLRKEI